MRLQTQLTLAFAVVSLAPILVLGGLARVVISNQYRGEFRRTLEQARDDVEREYQRLGAEVRDAVERIARSDDATLSPLLVDLAKGPLTDETRDDLQSRLEAQRRALGFDVLEVLSDEGELYAVAHFRGRAGDVDPAARRLARAGGAPQLVEEQILEDGRARRRLALEAGREVQAGFAGASGRKPRVAVVGGRVLGPRFLDRLPHRARLVDEKGETLFGAAAPSRWPRTAVELRRPDDSVAARVEIAVPDDELRHTLELIGIATAGLGVFAVLLAALVGALVARRFSAPLGDLAEGARAVARGELDARVAVRRSDEIGQVAEAFNAMTDDLRAAREDLVRAERVAAWREIAQRIAHEIKNPLTPIQMAIETLQRAHRRARARQPDDGSAGVDARGEQQHPGFDALFAESAQTILDEVARLKGIVGEFSSFARMPQPSLQPIDLNQVVESALALYAGSAPLERALAPSLPPIQADRDQLTQVLLNLLENARDAVAQVGAGRIRVCTRAAAGRVELEVADDGPGISEEARARLFTPYFTTKAKGTGLGLAIVYRIVSDHGAELRVGGAPGEGAVFTVSFAPASP